MDRVNYTVPFTGALDHVVFLKDAHVVLDGSIIHADEFGELIQVSRPLVDCEENLCTVFSAPSSSDQKPDQTGKLIIVLSRLLKLKSIIQQVSALYHS
jgi:hypothetical protein